MKAEELPTDAYRPRAVLSAISSAKNRLLSPSRYQAEADDFYRVKVVAVAYQRYQALMREAGGIDFDDMIRLAVELLRTDKAIKSRLRHRYHYLMVDEFQDTNHAQLQLIFEISGDAGNLTAVGDEDQSIYRWRGAELDNILDFEKSFPRATIRKLERNYRSTQNILDASGALVANNVNRRGKRLWTDAGAGDKLTLYRARDETDEARWVANVIGGLEADHPFSEIAILVRTNAQTRAFEERFNQLQLPYLLVGGVRFYERAEIKDLVAYLRFTRNPHDPLSFDRVLNRPPRGIGKKTREGLLARATAAGKSTWETLAAGDFAGIPVRGAKALERFGRRMSPLIEAAADLPLPALLDRLLDTTAYTDLFDSDDEDDQARLENIDEFRSGVQEFTDAHGYGSTEEDLLTAFLDHVSLVSDTDSLKSKPGISLMTLHSAKGLEFPVVFVGGLEENVLPHFNAQELSENLEEERRLLYVGMTRAEKRLFLTTCGRRRIAGQYQDQDPSRFLDEIPEKYLEIESSPELFTHDRSSWNRSRPRYSGRPGRTAAPRPPRRPAPEPPRTTPEPPHADAGHVYSFFGQKPATGSLPLAEPSAESGDPAPSGGAESSLTESSLTESSLTVEPVAAPTAAGLRLRRGSRVRHASLGLGRILQIEGSGDDMRLIIYFNAKGRKKLLAKYAQLEVL